MLTMLSLSILLAAGPLPEARAAAGDRVVASAGISGTVRSDDPDARPIRHARITLRSADGGAGRTTVTDGAGEFGFDGLAPGGYFVDVAKDGWIPTTYGARGRNRSGRSMTIAAGERKRITIALLRGAVITGQLLDQHGQPAAGAIVRAMRPVARGGERVLSFTGPLAVADDRGVYRIYNLPPGDYAVGATWRPAFLEGDRELRLVSDIDLASPAAGTASGDLQIRDRTVALAPTFFPGTTVTAEAAVLTLGGGEERLGVDFPMQIVPTARVAGTVIASNGQALPRGVQVSLMARGRASLQDRALDVYRETTALPDGSFTFVDIAPGEYTVFSRVAMPADRTPDAPQIVWASSDVLVEGDPISGVSLVLRGGSTISGRVRFEGRAAPVDLNTVRVRLLPDETGRGVSFAPASATIDKDGRFTIAGVIPGRYRLGASFPGLGRAGGWFLRSAAVGDIDALDVPLSIQPGQNVDGVVVDFTDRMASLSGVMTGPVGAPATGQTLILFPRDPALWTAPYRRIRSAQPGTDGAYSFEALPPGEYLLAAPLDVGDDESFDPAFFRNLAQSAMPVVIAEGERKVQDIRAGGGGR